MRNLIQDGKQLSVVVSSPAIPVSGDAVRFGDMTGVAVLNEGEGGCAATETTVKFDGGVYDLLVTDVATGGIAVGAVLYLHDGSPPTIDNVSASGYFFGYALEAISTGATDTIKVRHVQSPGAGTLGAGTVGTSNLAANAATTPKVANMEAKVEVTPASTVVAHAATATLTNTIATKNLTNTGASGTIVLTLPAASTMAEKSFRVTALVAQIIQLLPATGEKIYLNGSGVATKYLNIAGVIGNYCTVYCDGTDYFATNYSGVLTKEA